MNLIEAIRSGKPFRRKGRSEWCQRGQFEFEWHSSSCFDGQHRETMIHATRDDFFADDWEIQESLVSVTQKQVDEAIVSVVEAMLDTRGWFAKRPNFRRVFAEAYRRLGVEWEP